MDNFIIPQWPAPSSVKSAITLRTGGYSQPPFASNNLATHVQDDPVTVGKNRARLMESLKLPAEPLWLDQYHSTELTYLPEAPPLARADGSYSDQPNTVCVVLTADCLPVLFCNKSGSQIAAAHAGWRGLCGGILRNIVASFKDSADQIMAYLGPSIGPEAFEVGEEVLQAFLQKGQDQTHRREIEAAFRPVRADAGKYLADLHQLARAELAACGVTGIYAGDFCSYTDSDRFYSYRRESKTGRNASLIWLQD